MATATSTTAPVKIAAKTVATPETVDVTKFRCCGQVSSPKGAADTPIGSLVATQSLLWPNGSTLTVKIDGPQATPFVKGKIQQFANIWTEFANIHFSFVDSGDTHIRVAVNTSGGSWSVIGTGCLTVAQSAPTMNFGWFNDQTDDEEFSRVIVHEFGHAIGCQHEQASPIANIPWNKPVVYAYYLKMNGWDAAMVDSQVFAVLPQQGEFETTFDRTSIMEYAYPPEFTTDGSSAPWNRHLDDSDKVFIRKCYPFSGPQRTTTDGVYFVNCFNGDQRSSGVAWYKNMGGNDGKQPDAYIDVVKGGNVTWEGQQGSVTFPDGNTVTWNIESDGNWQPTYSSVGTAKNNFETWNVYKDNYRVLYEVNGWKCYTLYWCF